MLAPSFSVVLSAHAFKSDKLGKSWGYVRRRSLEQPSAAAAASRSPRSEFPVVEPVRPSGPVPALAPQYRWTVSRHHEHLTRQALKNGVHIASDNVNFPIKSNFNRPAAAADPLHKEEAKARPKVEKTVNMTFNLLVGNSIPTANLSDEFAVAHAASLSANVVNLTNAEDDLLLSVFAKVIWQAAAHHLKWFKSKAALVKVAEAPLSQEFRREKTHFVPFGLWHLDQNRETSGLVEKIHDTIVPQDEKGNCHTILVAGDQINPSRIRTVLATAATQIRGIARPRSVRELKMGVYGTASDFHADMVNLEVVVNQFYSPHEVGEEGSLCNLIDLMRVTQHDPERIQGNYNGWRDTLTTICDALLISALVTFFELKDEVLEPQFVLGRAGPIDKFILQSLERGDWATMFALMFEFTEGAIDQLQLRFTLRPITYGGVRVDPDEVNSNYPSGGKDDADFWDPENWADETQLTPLARNIVQRRMRDAVAHKGITDTVLELIEAELTSGNPLEYIHEQRRLA